jgi:hypothetical protein
VSNGFLWEYLIKPESFEVGGFVGLNAETKLVALPLTHWEEILRERFLIPSAELSKMGINPPETLHDVSELSGWPLDEVVQAFQEIMGLDAAVPRITVDEIDALAARDNCVVIDMRTDVDWSTEPLHPAAKMFHLTSPMSMLSFLKTCDQVLVLSDNPGKAWSASVFFRQQGIRASCLK